MAQTRFQSPLLLLMSMMLAGVALAEIVPSPCNPGPSYDGKICEKLDPKNPVAIDVVNRAIRWNSYLQNLTSVVVLQGEAEVDEGAVLKLLI
ncbi:OLC1v1016051C1 [Oldenlandia corymbosa var. corymbosa]|uniref:OLC1v1016051C1 n=1 Tax=Oldenlandia corymbosa var. corymbosa TaxID=529605 RepID=A0AAV1E4X2_OLDCO|nr:OLC1v1016051C1 [Oldenlandia corymbosa var. corymbosa]